MTQELTPEFIENELLKFIRETIVSEARNIDTNTLLGSLGIDSFNLIQIILFIERHFKISLPDAVLTQDNLKSVSSIAMCVHDAAQH